MAASETSLLKKLVKDELLKPRYRSNDPAVVAEAVMHEQGLASRFSNLLYQHKRAQEELSRVGQGAQRVGSSSGAGSISCISRPGEDELDIIVRLQTRWRQHVEASLKTLCSELGMPLMQPSGAVNPGVAARVNARGSRAAQMRGVYESSEMLEAIAATDHNNTSSGISGARPWGMVPLELSTPSLAELVDLFGDIGAAARQVRPRVRPRAEPPAIITNHPLPSQRVNPRQPHRPRPTPHTLHVLHGPASSNVPRAEPITLLRDACLAGPTRIPTAAVSKRRPFRRISQASANT